MKLLATDLDRTLLPDGPDPDDGALPLLMKIVEDRGFALAYVSGMDLDLLLAACREYGIRLPDRFIAEVGTALYRLEEGSLVRDAAWDAEIAASSPGWDRGAIERIAASVAPFELQEGWKQNPFKASFYLAPKLDLAASTDKLSRALADAGISASVLGSYDPIAKVGLADVLPPRATKADALEYVRIGLGIGKDDVAYCGDSGNDLPPLSAGYRSILVNNAPADVKRAVAERNRELGYPEAYVAHGADGRNGNYASGIIEGLHRFGWI